VTSSVSRAHDGGVGGELIGREDELALLRGLIAGLSRASAGVIVRGEAGIGKTVLVRAVAGDAQVARLRILSGGCAPLSGVVAYGGLDAALGVGRGVGGEVFSSVAAGRAWAVESMLTTLGEIAEGGAVLVVEDVHWADASTLDFLAYLSRNLPSSGLLVLLTWRDEDTDPEHARWIGEQLRNPAVTDLPLRRLTLEETGRQLAGCPAELVAAVYRRSVGNPYLSAELARGGAEPSESLRQVLVSRLDAASPAARTVVAAAATLGRSLTDDDLLAAASGDAEAVWEACEAGLMIRDPGRGSTARHPVLAELGYERLLSRDRRLLHTRMAEHLAAALPDQPTAAAVAEIAEQYRRAGDADSGLVWSVRAAQAAERGYAIAEAGHWYAVAAALWDSAPDARSGVPERLALLDAAATHLAAVGQAERAMGLLDGDLTAASGSDDLIVRAALTRSWLGTVLGDTERAMYDVELAEQLTSPDDELTWARVCACRALVLGTASRYELASGPARTALELGTKYGDVRTVGTAHVVLGCKAALEGNFSETLEHHETALAIARRVAEPEDLAMAGVVLTDLYWRLGDADRAAQVARAVRPEVRRLMLGRHWLEDVMDGNVVLALYEAGRWDEALAWISDPSAPSDLGFFQVALAEVHLARGDVAVAEELRRQAASLGERDQPQFLGWHGQVQTRLLLATGRAKEALDQALTIAEAVHGTLDEADEAGLLLAGLEAAVTANAPERLDRLVSLLGEATKGRAGAAVTAVVNGERSRAAGALDADPWLIAAREWAAVGRPYEEARAHLRAAEALLAARAGKRRKAAEELAAARQLAEDLRAVPLLADIHNLARLARIEIEQPVSRRGAVRDRTQPAPDATQWAPVLTDREKQVLALLADGRTNREIGDALFMSPKTASVHVTHILEKFGVQSRVQAAAMAARLGLDKPPDSSA
jgi:DNA-binding CsgD family transcriptional regulator/tetratricopeptide (TPR) repeat protein